MKAFGLRVTALLAAAAAAAAAPLHVPYTRTVLDNGLTVIVSEDHRLPLVGINTWFRVGSANERPGRTGFAHLFEHLMFMGSEHVATGEFDRLLEAAGGDNNATTGQDRTDYYEVVPRGALDLALYLDADRMGTLGKFLATKMLDAQRAVVENERRESYDNQPYGRTDETLLRLLFPEGHPYHWPVIGSMRDLDAATLSDVREFFSRYYSPNNAILSIAGDVEPADVVERVRRFYGAIPSGPAVAPLRPAPVRVPREIRSTLEDRVELPRLTLAWVTPALDAPGDAALDALANVLTGDRSARLSRRLVYDLQIAQDVSAAQDSHALASVFTITATARPGHGLTELATVIDEELRRIAREGVTASELDRAKNVFEASFLRRLQAVGGFGGLADQLAAYEFETGDPDHFEQDLDRYRRLETVDLLRAARDLLPEGRRVVLSVVPKGRKDLAAEAGPAPAPAPATKAPAVDWSRPPTPSAPAAVVLPPVARRRLGNGLRVWILERHNLPLVRASLVVPGGSSQDPPERPGLAEMTSSLLLRGTARRSALDLASESSALGAILDSGAGWDSSGVSIEVPTARWPEALDIFADVCRNPAFALPEIARVKADRAAQIRQDLTEPDALGARAFARAVFGDANPYGEPPSGTLDSVQALDRRDVVDFYGRWFDPSRAVLIVAGDVAADRLIGQIDKAFGDWRGESAGSVTVPPPPRPRPGTILIDRPGAPQSSIWVGEVGVSRATPDYFAVEIANTILGGSFTSRLNQNLRETHGYAYGAGSVFLMRRGRGPFLAQADVHTESTAPALEQILAEIRRIASEPPQESEVRRARNYLALSFPQSLETLGDVTNRLENLFLYDLAPDFYDRYVPNVESVTVAEAAQAARAHIHPENLSVVIVGDLSRIRADVSRIAPSPVEVDAFDAATGRLRPVRPGNAPAPAPVPGGAAAQPDAGGPGSAAGAGAGGAARRAASSSNSWRQK